MLRSTARDRAPRGGNPYKMRQKARPPAPPPTPAESEWKLFTELDMHEESEMLELSAFLTTLQEAFASASASKRSSLKILEEEEDDAAAARPSEVYSPLSAAAHANAAAAPEDDGVRDPPAARRLSARGAQGLLDPEGLARRARWRA